MAVEKIDYEMHVLSAEILAKLYLEANPQEDLNRNAIHRFAGWLVSNNFDLKLGSLKCLHQQY